MQLCTVSGMSALGWKVGGGMAWTIMGVGGEVVGGVSDFTSQLLFAGPGSDVW
jgi:hypothetical protein